MLDERPVYTLKAPPAVPASYDEAIERARALKPSLRERVAETERLRRLPAENVADLLENGLYGLMTPKRFGGSELGSEAMIDVTIELASACPSTGWVHMLWTAHMWLLALFPPEAQEELWSNPNTLASSVVNTVGDVVPVDGGYRWTGRGFFSSGVDHCNWLTAAVPIKREGVEGAARAALAADSARGLRDRRRLVHRRPEGHRQQDHRRQRRLHPRATARCRTRTSRRARRRAADPYPPDVRRDLVGQLHRRDGRAGGRRGARLPGSASRSACARSRATSTMA